MNPKNCTGLLKQHWQFKHFFYSVRGADAGNGIRVFIPDIGMFIAGLVTWLLCRSLEKPPGKDVLQHNTDFDMGNQVSLQSFHILLSYTSQADKINL